MFLRFMLVVFLGLCAENQANVYIRFQKLSTALDCLLDFVISDIHHMNVDGLFGIVIAQAQLEMLVQENLPKFEKNMAVKMLKKCHDIMRLPKSFQHEADIFDKVMNNLMSPTMWKINNSYDGTLPNLPPYSWSTEELKRNAFVGQPNEKNSDTCMGELMDLSILKNNSCQTSKFCNYVMNDLDESFGYPLAHKMLYMQMFRGLNCSLNSVTYTLKTRYLCTRILKEARTIEAKGYPPIMKDLFLEQIVLCGMEGFSQFMNNNWQDMLLSFQTEKCCYQFKDTVTDDIRWRMKRDSTIMSFKCDSHITGLAAAALAVNVRYSLTN